jgi:flagellar hook protein FlgE
MLGSNTAAGGLFTGLTPSTNYSMAITMNGSAAQSVTLTSNAAGEIDLADVVDEINNNVNGVTAAAVGGQLQLTSSQTGNSSTILVTPLSSGNDLAGVLGLSSTLRIGTQTTATSSTQLNAMPTNLVDYVDGDVIQVSGTDADGNVVDADFTFGAANDGTTVGDLVTFLQNSFPGSNVSFDATSGQIELTAVQPGEAEMSLVLVDQAGNSGSTNWAATAFVVETQGTGPDTVETSIQVYDASGVGHVVNFQLERVQGGTWQMSTSLPGDGDLVLSGGDTTLEFGADGQIQGLANANVTVQFAGASPQTIALNFAGNDEFDGLTQFGGSNSVVADFQDGYPAGALSNLSVNADGSVTGFYSNGQTFELGQFGIATFPNELGLNDVGSGYFAESGNSGQLRLGAASFGGVGEVVGGALEDSNVVTAEEFVRLIQAQRGFQANARIISIQNQLLEEAVNIV